MVHPASDGDADTGSFASRWLARPVIWLGGAASALMILAVFAITIYAIVMRYLLNDPLLWADEVTGWALVAIVMFGAAEAYRRGDHIAIDLLTTRATGIWRHIIAYVSDLGVLGFSVVVGISAWDAISFARVFGSYTSGHVVLETWILKTPILIGVGLLGMLAVIRLGERLAGRRNP